MTDTGPADDGLPLVGEDHGNRGLWIGLGAIGLGGMALFSALEASRLASTQPEAAPPQDYATAAAPRPVLAIPYALPQPQQAAPQSQLPAVRLVPEAREPTSQPSLRPSAPAAPAQPQPQIAPAPLPQQTPQAPDPAKLPPIIVYDVAPVPAAISPASESAKDAAAAPARATAIRGGDRTYLVPQGTLLYAVLETALDSTQSGQVRAMISSDVRNAAGTHILIPRGSRLFGEYKGSLSAGQNRAQIIWSRLIRPDGITIALESPASDPLGRAGIKGRVNSHFAARLMSALLQSSIDFGAYAASRAVTDGNGVIIAFPQAVQSSTSQLIQPPPQPTLKVRHGTRIAVFVSRDLDFSGVE